MRFGCRTLPGCALIAATALLVGGCSSGSTVATTPPVPTIANAKELRGHDPCAMLTAEQLSRLGLAEPGAASRAQEGPRCSWQGTGGQLLSLTLYTDGGGLETLAKNSDPTTARVRLDGYPALETFTTAGRFCQYDVGVATQQVMTVAMTNGAPDSCTALQSTVPTILSRLAPYSP